MKRAAWFFLGLLLPILAAVPAFAQVDVSAGVTALQWVVVAVLLIGSAVVMAAAAYVVYRGVKDILKGA